MNPGWNLGNTLDVIPTEGSWNNPPVDFSTFDVVKAACFKSIRLPEFIIEAINAAGSFNSQRVATLVGPGESVSHPEYFATPTNMPNPYAIQFHYYSPYDFIFGAWGKTWWGATADKTSLLSDLSTISAAFPNIPLLIGEWSATPVTTETAA
ncbi:hypothetical protein G7Y89_g10021 [Cudoniella acicularis]|uniref:Glycoside hydrolase family 5 domain-containing protein n=1 Tax=Cudoniella acicularis TaxID=354080 RepID=A0A8H4RG98_9HELO|nr:hypothetical protein G7Y89_g10021 [Cudoniella acicularis]